MTFVFVGMLWYPGHVGPKPDEFYAIPEDSFKKCMDLEMSFEKIMEDRASVSQTADEVAARWTSHCQIYMSGNGKDPI